MNKLIFMGRVVRTPELRKTNSGIAVADVTIVSNRNRKGKDGEWIEEATFVDCVAWSAQAESLAKKFPKGSAIMIEGSLVNDQWETEEGEKRSKLRVRIEKIHRPTKDSLKLVQEKAENGVVQEEPIEQTDDIPF